jgi:hypothetical protein
MLDYLRKVKNFPLPQLEEKSPLASLYDVSMNPACPILFSVLYVLVVASYNSRRPCRSVLTKKSNPLLLLHNLFLAVYSFW